MWTKFVNSLHWRENENKNKVNCYKESWVTSLIFRTDFMINVDEKVLEDMELIEVVDNNEKKRKHTEVKENVKVKKN